MKFFKTFLVFFIFMVIMGVGRINFINLKADELSISTGWMDLRANGYLTQGSFKASELNWKASLFALKIGYEMPIFHNQALELQTTWGIDAFNKNTVIDDDWNYETSLHTHHSISDVHVILAFAGDLAHKLLIYDDTFQLFAGHGLRFEKYKLYAYNIQAFYDCSPYPHNCQRIWNDSLSVGGFHQEYLTYYLGFWASKQIKDFEIKGFFKFSPINRARAKDFHYQRELYSKFQTHNVDFYNIGLELNKQFKDLTLGIKAEYSVYGAKRTTIDSTDHGVPVQWPNTYSFDNKNLFLGLTAKYSF